MNARGRRNRSLKIRRWMTGSCSAVGTRMLFSGTAWMPQIGVIIAVAEEDEIVVVRLVLPDVAG